MIIQELIKDKYILRIITPPYLGLEHSIGKLKIKCGHNSDLNGYDCPGCRFLGKNQSYWLVGCIDRDLNDYGVFKFDRFVYQSIRLLANNPTYGEPKHYDLTLIKNYQKKYYNLIADRRSALSETDLLLKKKVDEKFLRQSVAPPSLSYFKDFQDRFENKLSTIL